MCVFLLKHKFMNKIRVECATKCENEIHRFLWCLFDMFARFFFIPFHSFIQSAVWCLSFGLAVSNLKYTSIWFVFALFHVTWSDSMCVAVHLSWFSVPLGMFLENLWLFCMSWSELDAQCVYVFICECQSGLAQWENGSKVSDE